MKVPREFESHLLRDGSIEALGIFAKLRRKSNPTLSGLGIKIRSGFSGDSRKESGTVRGYHSPKSWRMMGEIPFNPNLALSVAYSIASKTTPPSRRCF